MGVMSLSSWSQLRPIYHSSALLGEQSLRVDSNRCNKNSAEGQISYSCWPGKHTRPGTRRIRIPAQIPRPIPSLTHTKFSSCFKSINIIIIHAPESNIMAHLRNSTRAQLDIHHHASRPNHLTTIEKVLTDCRQSSSLELSRTQEGVRF